FDKIAAFQYRNRTAVGTGDLTREAIVGTVGATFFEFFNAPPALGRYFSRAEDQVPTGTPVVVISYAFWHLQYGGRTDIIGTPLKIDKTSYAIIGVAPEDFTGMDDGGVPVAFIPITAYASAVRGPGWE